ncbi:hypothetical protein RvY_03651-1, partial [Ramazzottius varieornatus]
LLKNFNTNSSQVLRSSPVVDYPRGIISAAQTILAITATTVFFRSLARCSPRSSFTVHTVSVVLADLMCAFFTGFMAVQAFVGHWPFNEHACSFAVFLLYAGGVKSLHCELLIALNRFW